MITARALGVVVRACWEAALDLVWLACVLGLAYLVLLIAAPHVPALEPVLRGVTRMAEGVARFVSDVAAPAHLR